MTSRIIQLRQQWYYWAAEAFHKPTLTMNQALDFLQAQPFPDKRAALGTHRDNEVCVFLQDEVPPLGIVGMHGFLRQGEKHFAFELHPEAAAKVHFVRLQTTGRGHGARNWQRMEQRKKTACFSKI